MTMAEVGTNVAAPAQPAQAGNTMPVSKATNGNETTNPVAGQVGAGAPGAPGNVTQGSLYVGDLHPDVTEANVYEVMSQVGAVASVRICRDSISRGSLGYGYVNFHRLEDAERALNTLNFTNIKGKQCRVMWASQDPSARKSAEGNVFIKNLDRKVGNKDLFDAFSIFGNILSCKVAQDEYGRSKGFGFVHFEREEDAKEAINRANNTMIGDKTVFVGKFQKKTERGDSAQEYSGNLYVKHFPTSWEEDDLKKMFEKYGEITSCVCMTDAMGRKFGFVNFESGEAADKAIEELHKKDMRPDDKKDEDPPPMSAADEIPPHLLYVGKAQSKKERVAALSKGDDPDLEKVQIFVKNVSKDIDEEKLKAHFADFGEIVVCKIKRGEDAEADGFGYVGFEDPKPEVYLKAVKEMHLKELDGKPLYVATYIGVDNGKGAKGESKGKGKGKGGNFGGKGKGKGKGKGMNNYSPMYNGGYPNQMDGSMGGQFGMPGQMPGQMPMNPMQRMPMMQQQMPNVMWRPVTGARPVVMGNGMMPGARPGMPQQQMHAGAPQGQMPFNFTATARNAQMPQMPMQQQTAPMQNNNQNPQNMFDPNKPLTAAVLAAAPPGMQKQMLGEKLFPKISDKQKNLAGKITGMMLEMDNSEILMLLESEQQMNAKIDEAVRVLESRQQPQN